MEILKRTEKKIDVREGVAYLIFGILTTVVDYLISNGLYYGFSVSSIVSQTAGWAAAVIFAFVTNKWWVFKSYTLKPLEVWREFQVFVACRVATLLFSLLAVWVLVDFLGMEFFIGKILISAVVVVLNYVFSKILIFTKKDGR